MFRPAGEDGGLVFEVLLTVGAAQGTLDLVCGAIHRFQSFVEPSIVAVVRTQLSLPGQVLPPVVLDLPKPALKDAAGSTEAGFLLGKGGLC